MVKAVMSWSSGKDSAYALGVAKTMPDLDIIGALTTLNGAADRVAMHGVRRDVMSAQMAAIGLPPFVVELPYPCSNEDYAARMGVMMDDLLARGVEAVIFGDLFLEDVRQYRIDQLNPLGVEAIFPLWQRPTDQLAQVMIASGVETYICTLDPRIMPPELAGRRFDQDFLDALPDGVDHCGENGEFHTVVANAPAFGHGLELNKGITVERDGFVFTDFEVAI